MRQVKRCIVVALLWSVAIVGRAWSEEERPFRDLNKMIVGDGVELHYFERGAGVPVVFIHGGLEDCSLWTDQAREFGKTYRAIAYSRRYNYPNNNPVTADYSAAVEADDLAALIQQLNLGKCHIIGFSYGGTTALFLAVRHPELVRTLTLAEPALIPWLARLSPPRTEQGRAVLADYTDKLVNKAREEFAEPDIEGALRVTLDYLSGEGMYDRVPQHLRDLWKRNTGELKAILPSEGGLSAPRAEEVRALEIPTLLLAGEKSAASCQLVTAELELLLKTERKMLPGATHAMWIDRPEMCRELVLKFLREAEAAEWNHQPDVVYGNKDGLALVMDVYAPNQGRNGAGVLRLMSGGMVSSPTWSHSVTRDRPEVRSLLDAGYVVFAVAHGCQPKYRIDEILPDITRATRYIRHNAERFGIDPQRLGIMGASSGGHLSLLAGTAAPASRPEAKDPVDRESSRVQAVVAYYPGTDNLNFGHENVTILEHFRTQGERTGEATFDFHRWDDGSMRFERVTDPVAIRTRFRDTSPIAHVDAATAPVLILHGDQDTLVPLQQSEVFMSRLQHAGVPHKLVVVPGVGHGYSNGWERTMHGEIEAILDWFNRYLIEEK